MFQAYTCVTRLYNYSPTRKWLVKPPQKLVKLLTYWKHHTTNPDCAMSLSAILFWLQFEKSFPTTHEPKPGSASQLSRKLNNAEQHDTDVGVESEHLLFPNRPRPSLALYRSKPKAYSALSNYVQPIRRLEPILLTNQLLPNRQILSVGKSHSTPSWMT